MNSKIYPKAVMLKKNIVSITVMAIVGVVALILYNIHQSSRQQSFSQAVHSENVDALASSADTQWYQEKSMQKSQSESTVSPSVEPAVTTRNVQAEKSSGQEHSMRSEREQHDLLQAMRTPISSNQLVTESSSTSKSESQHTAAMANDAYPSAHSEQPHGEKKAFMQAYRQMSSDVLVTTVQPPISPYSLSAGTLIPGILITGINSDLPGQIIGQVRTHIYDTISGKHVLIPQGAKLIGAYDSQVAYGQHRVLVAWQRIIFPNGQSLAIPGMPGVDRQGYSGFNDEVHNHYGKIFGSAMLMSVLGAGAQLAQPAEYSNASVAAPTIGQTLAQSLGTSLANVGTMMTSKNINIQPELIIRPGYLFNMAVTQDIVFPGPYGD